MSIKCGRAKRSAAGFSLIELLIVIVVIGVLSATALPAIARYRRNYQVRQAAEGVAGEIQAARLRAITRNATRGIVFVTLDNQSYQWLEVPKTGTGNVDIATLTGGTVYRLPAGVVFDTPSSNQSTMAFNSLGALCATTTTMGCPTLTNVPTNNYINLSSTNASVRVRQPSTNLTRTIDVSSGGRVTR